jgi:hypothetical protein
MPLVTMKSFNETRCIPSCPPLPLPHPSRRPPSRPPLLGASARNRAASSSGGGLWRVCVCVVGTGCGRKRRGVIGREECGRKCNGNASPPPLTPPPARSFLSRPGGCREGRPGACFLSPLFNRGQGGTGRQARGRPVRGAGRRDSRQWWSILRTHLPPPPPPPRAQSCAAADAGARTTAPSRLSRALISAGIGPPAGFGPSLVILH